MEDSPASYDDLVAEVRSLRTEVGELKLAFFRQRRFIFLGLSVALVILIGMGGFIRVLNNEMNKLDDHVEEVEAVANESQEILENATGEDAQAAQAAVIVQLVEDINKSTRVAIADATRALMAGLGYQLPPETYDEIINPTPTTAPSGD